MAQELLAAVVTYINWARKPSNMGETFHLGRKLKTENKQKVEKQDTLEENVYKEVNNRMS